MQALGQQSEAVQRAAAALSASMARARTVRLVIVLAGVALIAVVCVKFYSLGIEIQSPEYLNALVASGQKRLAENSDRYRGEVDKLVEHASPAVSKAFTEQAKKDLPEFLKKMEKEKDTLAADLQEDFSNRLNTHYERLLAQQENTLKQEFPAIKDDATHERMVKNLDKAVQKLVKKYHVEEFRRKVDELVFTWDHFPEANRPGAGEPSLEDQLITTLLQVLAVSLGSSGFPGR
jgi:hypothetical protein